MSLRLLLIFLLSFSVSGVIVWYSLRWLDPWGYSRDSDGLLYAALATCPCGEVATETVLIGDGAGVRCEYCGRLHRIEREVWAKESGILRREVEEIERSLRTRAKVREYAEEMVEAYDSEGVDAEKFSEEARDE